MNWSSVLGVVIAAIAVVRGIFELRISGTSETLRFPAFNVQIDQPDAAVNRFAGILQYRTISDIRSENHVINGEEFENLLIYLKTSFPLVWANLEVQNINQYSLLLKWKGRNAQLNPLLCISHTDVVPVGPEESWTHPPFGGVVADGYVWGRGAQDVKVTVTALLEAVTYLIQQGYEPERTLYLGFGHDEEVGGGLGAAATASLLEREGVRLAAILDEGGGLALDGLPPITAVPVARIGLAEKGYVTMEVVVAGVGGHSSVPPITVPEDRRPIAQLATLLRAMEAGPSNPKLVPTVHAMLEALSVAVNRTAVRYLFQHSSHWAVEPILARWMVYWSGSPWLAAVSRTTAAVTDVATSPPGDNVLPDSARVLINFRPLPGEEDNFPERFIAGRLQRAGVDGRFSRLWSWTAPPATAPQGTAYEVTRQAILETLVPPEGQLIVIPSLETGGTDSWSYQNLTSNILRFDPIASNGTEERSRVHAVDERCSVAVYLNSIRFYIRFLQLALQHPHL